MVGHERHIFVDLDGVLVDFEGGFALTFGRHHKSMIEPEMWKMIASKGEEYWMNLPALPDYNLLWDFVSEYQPTILTGLPRNGKTASVGKKRWCLKNLTPFFGFISCMSKEKQKFMKNPGDILIDDRADNCKRWQEAGGVGIVHTNIKDTINELKQLGF